MRTKNFDVISAAEEAINRCVAQYRMMVIRALEERLETTKEILEQATADQDMMRAMYFEGRTDELVQVIEGVYKAQAKAKNPLWDKVKKEMMDGDNR